MATMTHHYYEDTDSGFAFFVSLIIITIFSIAFVLYGLPLLRELLGITSYQDDVMIKTLYTSKGGE